MWKHFSHKRQEFAYITSFLPASHNSVTVTAMFLWKNSKKQKRIFYGLLMFMFLWFSHHQKVPLYSCAKSESSVLKERKHASAHSKSGTNTAVKKKNLVPFHTHVFRISSIRIRRMGKTKNGEEEKWGRRRMRKKKKHYKKIQLHLINLVGEGKISF